MSFNSNYDGIAPNVPCVPNCPNRTAYCHSYCEKYKEWSIIQKHYSNKVKILRKKQGMGTPWNAKYKR